MTRHQDVQNAGCPPSPPLTADECRLLADRFLDHLGADPVQNDSLNSLAQHLMLVALWEVERNAPSSLTEDCEPASAQVAPKVTPPEVGLRAVRLGV